MDIERAQSGFKPKLSIRRLYCFLTRRAHSVIMFGALFCNLAAKFFHSYDNQLVNEYFSWILADIAVLLVTEAILTVLCFRWPRRSVIRTAMILAAVICTWSIMNAAWIIRTGTQILPSVLLPLLRDPINSFGIIGVNLAKMPAVAVILLGPSAVALTFFFFALAKPQSPNYSRKYFLNRTLVSCVIILVALLARAASDGRGSAQIASAGLRYNCQLKAVTNLLLPGPGRLARAELAGATRKIPVFDQLNLAPPQKTYQINHNVVIVVLEGIQYSYTSLADRRSNLTPHLLSLARQGVEFANTRSTLTHTTKVLFSLMTGRFPSVSQDIVEAIPAAKPYAAIATILKQNLNFRTAFFQSAKGNFESRAGLVYNLGFDKFWARDDLNDPNAFIGYLACDEFSMLKPITEWIKAGDQPFFLTVLCSVTHDPYEVPEWFAEPAKEPLERYRQAIFYTDKFIAAIDTELARLNLTDKTIFCVVGDHGEAFGEHGRLGHERIAFDEVLHIPWVIRAPFLVDSPVRVTEAVSSVDVAPTLLTLLGFDTTTADFDGSDALSDLPDDRKVYFSGWIQQGPTGFVKDNRKFIYNPTNKMVSIYDLSTDPLELTRTEPPDPQAQKITQDITAWRKSTVFHPDQHQSGKKTLFDSWICRWNNRICSAKYRPQARD